MAIEILDDNTQQQPESKGEYLKRGALRTLARTGESMAGLPGDIAQLGLGLGSYLTGGEIPTYQQVKEKFPVYLPTSEDIRKEITQDISGQYLEPKTSGEEFYDRIIGDAASILIPVGELKTLGAGVKPLAKATARALGVSTAANTAQWAGETIVGPKTGVGAKIGTVLLANLLGSKQKVRAMQRDLYDKAFSNLPPDRPFNLGPQNAKMETLKRTIEKGDLDNKNWLLDRIKAYEDLLTKEKPAKVEPTGLLGPKGESLTKTIPGQEGGFVEQMKELVTLKQQWNAKLADPSLDKATRNDLLKMIRIANEGISKIEKTFPEFSKYYRVGEEITEGLKSQNILQTFLDKHPYLQKNIKNPIIGKILFGVGTTAGGTLGHLLSGPQIAGVAGVGAAAFGAREVFKAFQLIMKSPAARTVYKSAVKHALLNDTRLFKRDLGKLEDIWNKSTGASKGGFEIE